MALSTERLDIHGIDLEALRGGSGPRVLVLHGPTTYATETSFLALLARDAEVIAASHPGFGTSARPGDFDSMYDLVRLYQDILDTLPDERVTLIGCSFGGWI